MPADAQILRRLAALNLPGEAMSEVLAIIAEIQETPASNRSQRDRRYYASHRETILAKRRKATEIKATESDVTATEIVVNTTENPLAYARAVSESILDKPKVYLTDKPKGSELFDFPESPKPPSKSKPKKQDFRPHLDAMVEAWNRLALSSGLPPTRGMTARREAVLRQRARDLVDVLGYADPVGGFQALIEKVRASPLLTGQVGSWRASFDWVIKEANFLKIMEGNYEKNQTFNGNGSNGYGRHEYA